MTVLAAALVAGCAPTTTVVLDFPTQRSFEVSELVRIDVVRIAPDALGSCPDVTDATLRAEPLDVAIAVEPTSVCDIQAGLAVGDPGSGPLAFVAQVIDDRNTVILLGCTVAEAFPGAPPVRIEFYPTAEYTESEARAGSPGTRAGASCGGGA